MSTVGLATTDSPAGVSTRRALATAGTVYVAGWLIGLGTVPAPAAPCLLGRGPAPAAPQSDAADATIQAFYADHGPATMLQATLVHGIAGVALAVFVACLVRRVAAGRADRTRAVLLGAGLGAAGVSLVQ